MSAVVMAGLISVGGALAQTPASPSKPAASTTSAQADPSIPSKVEKWTDEEWSAAKEKWTKDKVKWAACEQQSTDQKLVGRKSWAFLYDCMI
jgi:hypothetical protein